MMRPFLLSSSLNVLNALPHHHCLDSPACACRTSSKFDLSINASATYLHVVDAETSTIDPDIDFLSLGTNHDSCPGDSSVIAKSIRAGGNVNRSLVNDLTPAIALLMKKETTCLCALTPVVIDAIQQLADGIASVTGSDLDNLLGTIFDGLEGLINTASPLLGQVFAEFFKYLSLKNGA